MDSTTIAQAVLTPQVILGADYEAIFQQFEEIRSPTTSKIPKDLSVAEWYVKAVALKDAIFLSTLENSDILSFTHKFNSDSPQDQGLFVLEVLDPANIFEHRFLDFFYNRTQLANMTDANMWLGEQVKRDPGERSDFTAFEFGDGRTFLPNAFNVEQGRLDKYSADAKFAAGERRSAPFSKSVMITCGIGNNIKTWAPVQRCSLVAMDYDLTKEGLRKLTLKFVPNPGLLRYNEHDAVDDYLTAGAKTRIQIQQDFIALNATVFEFADGRTFTGGMKPHLVVVDPAETVLDLISKSFVETTDSPAILLLDNLKVYLNKRWKKACITAVNQALPTATAVRMSDALLKVKPEEWPDRAVSPTGNLDKFLAAKTKLVNRMMQFNTPQFGPGEIANFTTEGDLTGGLMVAREDIRDTVWVEHVNSSLGTTIDPTGGQKSITVEGAENEMRDLYLNLKGYRRGWTLARVPYESLTPEGQQIWDKAMKGGDPVRGALGVWAGGARPEDKIGPEVGYAALAAAAEGHSGGPEAIYGDLSGRKYVPSELGPPHTTWWDAPGIKEIREWWYEHLYSWHYLNRQEAFQESLGIEDIYTVKSIEIDSVEMYKIYLKAAQIFFGGLGMQVLERGDELKRRGTLPIGPNPNGSAPRGAPDRTLIEDAIKAVYIQISAKNVQGIRGHVDNILQSLGAHADLDPYISCFGELGLINRCRKEFSKPKNKIGKKYVFLSQGTPNSLFIVASYDVMGSLINGDELDKEDITRQNPAYPLLKKAFADFRAGEPAITSNAGGLAKMFQNPEPDALLLPSDNDTPNMLALFSDSDLEFANNDELNKYLSEKKIPVFNYGFENSNILDFHFDLKVWYAYLLTLVPEMLTDELTIRGVNSLDITDSVLKFYEAEGSPEDIKGLIGRWYDAEYGSAAGMASLVNSPTNFMAVNVVAGVPGAAPASVGPGGNPAAPWTPISQQISPHLPHRQLFIDNMYNFMITILSRPSTSRSILFDPGTDHSEIVNDILNIRSKLSNRTFVGRVTTVPFFSLMSMAKTLGKPALLYFLEPEAMASNEYKEGGGRNTWLSGEYYIVGFEVRIAGNSVTTSFNLLKNASNK